MAAKPSRRSRLTSNPMAVRANGNSIKGRRLRDLFAAFAAKIDPDDVVGRAAALRAAELTAACEALRCQIMTVDLSQADDAKLVSQAKLAEQLTRLENSLDRAERRLAKLEPPPKSSGERWQEERLAAEAAQAELDRAMGREPPPRQVLDPIKIYQAKKAAEKAAAELDGKPADDDASPEEKSA